MADLQNFSPFGHKQGYQDPTSGAWVENLDNPFDAKIAISYATANDAVIWTVPEGKRVLIEQVFYEITTAFTGGTSAAIGLSSSRTPHDAAGDILGGSGGDVLAGLTAGIRAGTAGTSFSATPSMVVLEPGDAVKFNRIASAFTAGAGYVHLIGRIIN